MINWPRDLAFGGFANFLLVLFGGLRCLVPLISFLRLTRSDLKFRVNAKNGASKGAFK